MNFKKQNKGIISLAAVFTIGFLALSIAMATSVSALQELKKGFNTVSGDKTFLAAEAAAGEGIYQYIKDDTYSVGTIPLLNNVSANSITVNSSLLGWAYREILGTAENNLTNRKVKNTVLLFPSGVAFDYAVYSEKDLFFTGNASIIGDVFSNSTTSCGGSSNIEGNAYAAGINDCDGYASSTHQNVNIIPPPEIDFQFYYDIALTSGTLFTTTTDAQAYLNGNTINAVVFVDDSSAETDIQTAELTGSLVVIGDLRLRGGTVITATNNYAAIAVNGNLRITGNTTIYGLVYVSGTTNFSGGNNFIYGSIISVGGTETDITGSVVIDYNMPSEPPEGLVMDGNPEIIGWQEE